MESLTFAFSTRLDFHDLIKDFPIPPFFQAGFD
jgi:hypothetical protein